MKFKSQKGAAVVEFAVVLPLLLVLLFGIIEISVLLYDKAMLTNASREGARAAIVYSVPRLNDSDVRNIVIDYCSNYLFTFDESLTLNWNDSSDANGEITITPDYATVRNTSTATGQLLAVRVVYPFRFLIFSNLLGLIGSEWADVFELEAVTVMRME